MNNSLKLNENKQAKVRSSSSRPYETNSIHLNKNNYLPPSPLAAKDYSKYTNSKSTLMPPPSNTTVLYRNNNKKVNNDDIYQNNEDQHHLRESKENIFI